MALDPGGGGDFLPRDQEQCHFGKLNEPELRHICQFLHWKDHLRMMQLCYDFKDYFEYIYGIHAYLPPRNFNLDTWSIIKLIMGRLSGMMRQITDDMSRRKILNLEGKVIRGLEMNELHPEFNPFPFEKLIHFPFRLREVRLKYVDVQFLIKILSSCRNLTTFHYETGHQRHLPQAVPQLGLLARILRQASFQPVPIPLGKEQLIEYITQLPPPNFQVENLTSLSLSIQTINIQLHSDWANILFLLLSLSSENLHSLKKFKFRLQFGYHRTNPKDRLQTVACVGHFLSRCPSLQKLDYTSCLPAERDWILLGEQVDGNWFDTATGLPQNVLSGLIQKYVSDLLKEVQGPNTLGWKQRMLAPIRQIMQEAGRRLRNVRNASFQFVNRMEPDVFQHLLSTLPSPSIESIFIDDYSGPRLSHPNYYTSLLPSMEHQPDQQHSYQRIEKLCVHRLCDFETFEMEDDRRISLSQMLGMMRSLKHLEITLRIPLDDIGSMEGDEGFWQHEPIYDLEPLINGIRNENGDFVDADGGGRTPDMIIGEVADATLFHRVEVLKLKGVKLAVEVAERLSQWRNLKELILMVIPEYEHELFGIRSDDLLRMMGNLRRLDKLSVNMIYLPQGAALNLVHRTALEEIGSLTEMNRLIKLRQPTQDAQGRMRSFETKRMTQYKFLFNCDETNYHNW